MLLSVFLFQEEAWAQPTGTSSYFDYETPREFVLAGLNVEGAQYTDPNTIKLFTGLQVGERITVPGDRVSQAIRNLWKQQLFTGIEIKATSIQGENIYLTISLQEVPRLSLYKFEGISKNEQGNLREKLKLSRGVVVTENLKSNSERIILNYYKDKGFYNARVTTNERKDNKVSNSTILEFVVDRGPRVKIEEIVFAGNEQISDKKLLRTMNNTKEKRWWRVFKSSKLIDKDYEDDKQAIVALYNKKGFRDARVIEDTVDIKTGAGLGLGIKIYEGNQFYFGDIGFVGNTKYSSDSLRNIIGIRKGDLYNMEELSTKIYSNPKGLDVSALYMDDGYLTYQIYPVETRVQNDTIDIEIRMIEGKQFRIGKVTVVGNSKTNDHVVYREIRTLPGDLFSRTNIMRTQRELAQLGYFNPEAFGVNPVQHPETGTVDLEYLVEEKPSDQIELSGGFGAGGVVGTLGLRFTNFSARKFFKGPWNPVPTGDGQQLSIRGQTNGRFFRSVNISFVEPWLGGKKPNTLSVSTSWSQQSNGVSQRDADADLTDGTVRTLIDIKGGSIGYGKRFQWPDDYFSMFANINYQRFTLDNSSALFSFSNGVSNNLSLSIVIQRNSINEPIYPTTGSTVKLTGRFTLPYSKWGIRQNDDWASASDQDKFRWVEYNKWKFTADWYTPLTRGGKERKNKLVFRANAGVGILQFYNQDIGLSPFERFYLGGVFLSGFVLDGREIINLRGYDDNSISAPTGSPVINRFTAELRYPVSTNPSATVFLLGFAEAGNTWGSLSDYNPFELKRSAGVGLRIFLPMFGLIGLDYGWRFDDVPGEPTMARSQFHFSIGAQVGDL